MSPPLRFALACPPLLFLALFPALLVGTGRGGSVALFVLAAWSLVLLGVARGRGALHREFWPEYRGLAASMAAVVLICLATQATHAHWTNSELERALRMSLGMLLVLAALLHMEPRWLRQAGWGPLAGCWVASAVILSLAWSSAGRPITEEYNTVSYSNLMLIFTVLTVYSLKWKLSTLPKIEKALKIITAAVAFYAFLLTQTRTGWLALPLFIIIGLVIFNPRVRVGRNVGYGVLVLVIAAALGMASHGLRDRTERGMAEIVQCEKAPLTDSSLCIRSQLWHAAWRMFTAHPFSGVGSGQGFRNELHAYEREGAVSSFVADNFGEPHNDMLYALSTAGLPGGIALLLVYLAPAWIFARRLARRDLDPAVRAAAAMGLAFTLGFAILGTTEFMFRGMRTVGFYAAFVGWLLAASDERGLPEQNQSA
jgi:O-antigen ligase